MILKLFIMISHNFSRAVQHRRIIANLKMGDPSPVIYTQHSFLVHVAMWTFTYCHQCHSETGVDSDNVRSHT